MKNLKFLSLMAVAIFMSFAFTSCGEDENSTLKPTEEDEVTFQKLIVVEGDNSQVVTVNASDYVNKANINVIVDFKANEEDMKRVYMTENVGGAGAEKYVLKIEDLDTKGDGSIDLGGALKDSFRFKIPFPNKNVTKDGAEGTVEYKIWATHGRGDYRNTEKRLVALGTVVINYGGENATNPEVKEYTQKIFAAPLADGSSESFISLIDGKLYKINQGEEFVSYWDFGYYYLNDDKASFASTFAYSSTDVLDIIALTGANEEDLNKCYFANSQMDFDAVKNSDDLNAITKSDAQEITGLKVGSLVEFVDNYGKKGLIKVVELKEGMGTKAYIKVNIKVQP